MFPLLSVAVIYIIDDLHFSVYLLNLEFLYAYNCEIWTFKKKNVIQSVNLNIKP